MTDAVAQYIKPGDHGTTFGGGPLATAVAVDVLSRIIDPAFLRQVAEKGAYMQEKLHELKKDVSHIVAIRGKGLMLAIEISVEPKELIRGELPESVTRTIVGHLSDREIGRYKP